VASVSFMDGCLVVVDLGLRVDISKGRLIW